MADKLQLGSSVEREAMRKKLRSMRRASKNDLIKNLGGYKLAIIEMTAFLRQREPRTRKKKGGL